MGAPMQPDGVGNFATAILFIVIDTLAVALRLIAKHRTKRSFGSDDVWMSIALVFYYVWAGLIIYSNIGVSGTLEILQITELSTIGHLTKILWIASPVLPLTITPLKISILCFYRSVFPLPWFKRATWILTTLCVLWLFSGFWVIIFQCSPTRAVYDLSLEVQANAHCVEFGNFVFLYELLNALLDVGILALPAFVIPGLNLPLRRKVQVLAIFFMGGFVLVTCVLRMVYSYNPKDPKAVPSYSKGILWSTIELGVAILCGNLPTYRPLFPKTDFWATITSCSSAKTPRNPFDNEDETQLTQITGPSNADELAHYTYELNAISVASRVDVESVKSY